MTLLETPAAHLPLLLLTHEEAHVGSSLGHPVAHQPMAPAQMAQFIHASEKAEGSGYALYLKPEEIEQYKGKEVKFVKGLFEGIEGYIRRINKNKMVVVTLKDLISIALPVSRKDELMFL